MVDINAIERALLLNVVKDGNWELLILNDISEDYFSQANKSLFNYIREYVECGKYPDIQILCFNFKITDDELGSYLSIHDTQGLCNTLKNEYLKSELVYNITQLNQSSQDIYKDPVNYIESIGEVYTNLRSIGFKNKSLDLFDRIEDILTIDPNDVISTGFKELDEKLIGWKRGEELVTIVGRTGQGKSWLGLKFALSAALQGERVGIYSGEMSKLQLQERILCCAKQNYTDTKEDAVKFINNQNLCIRIITPNELRRRANVNDIEEMIVRDKLTMVVIDQLSLMEDITPSKGTPLRMQYGNISADLFGLSQRYNLPALLLAQSNRQGSAENTGPQLENIAESDAVAQNSTRVITMKNEMGILTMNIVKNRYGESGLTQRYEVDYGINKYKPLKDTAFDIINNRSKQRDIFGRK